MPRLLPGFVAMPRRLVVLAALLGALVSVPAAGAASNVTVLSGLNGAVYSSAVDSSSNRFYGGDFTAVDAPRTRQSAVVDATTGAPDTSFPAVSGGSTSSVNASVSDGSGGWFIGGSFTCVNSDATSGCTGAGEVAQVGVAHILADGSVDTSWTGQLVAGTVTTPTAYTMVRVGSTLYVGGAFSNALSGGVSSTTRTNLAAFDTTTGALQSWNPTANGTVWSMINNGSTLYVGGAFTSITPVGGSATTRNRFAALDATTGALLTLNPNINNTVRALALDATAGIVYVGGDFTAATANGWPYKGIVAVNTAGGVNATWTPNVINTTGGAGVTALAFDATNSKLYIGGNFTDVYSTSYPRSRLAALSTSSTCMSANWALSTTRDTCIDAWSPGTLQMSRDVLLTANTPTSLSSNPVMTLALDGGNLLVGGCFTGIGATIRRGAARISTTTGAVAAWDPNPSVGCVNTIVPGSTTTYLGGGFTTTGGTKRAGVVSYDAAGALRAWNPGVDARPTTMELNGSTLYLGGLFNIAGGQQRIQLAGLDLTSGAATGLSIAGLSTSNSSNAAEAVRDIAVTTTGSTIYVAGLFDCVGDRYTGSCGGTTRGYAAAFATANGALQAWAPTFSGSPVATRLALDADNVYFAGGFSGFVANGTTYTRLGVAAFANDPTTTTVRPWDAGLDGSAWGVATDGTNVYLAGQFSAVQGQPRVQMAAVAAADASTVTPALRAWAPSIGSLSIQGTEGVFLDISADGQYLYGVNQYIRGTNGGTGPRVMTSADGASWTGRSAARDFGSWRSIAFGGGTFVAVASNGAGNRVMTSTDGATWTSRASAADNTWVSVAYGNGLFVAVAQTGTGNRVMTSPDGIIWTSRTSAANNAWTSVTFGNGLFVAVANSGSGNRIMTSPDGITWTSRNAVSDASAWSFVTYAGGLFVAVASAGTTRLMTSPDGIAWTAGTIEQRAWASIAYGNGRFVAISSESAGGYASTSTNGTAWTTGSPLAVTGTFNSVAYGDGQYVAVGSGQGGVNVLTSADGATWVPQRSGTPSTWTGVAYGGGRFVAVANANLGNRSGGLAVRLGSCLSSWNAATCVSDWDPGLRSGVAVNAFSLLPDGGAVAAVGSFAPVTIGTPTSTRFVLTVDNSSAGSLAVSVGGSGSFNGLPISCGATCSASFTPGAVVTLVVNTTTGLGYQFSSWGGDCSGTATSCTLTMDAAKSVSVLTSTAGGATTNTLTLATTGTGAGSITTVPTGATCPGSGAGCTASFASTETLQLVPTATSGAFIGWSGACMGVGTCVVTMSQARSVTAEFGPSQTLSLATTGTGGGSIASSNPSGFTCFSTCSRPLPDGATVTLTPIADSTSLFTGWSGACTGTGACTVPMTQARSVTATFTSSVTWVLSVATAGSGSGSVSSSPSGITCGATCTASFVDTTSVTLTATASSGSTFTGWSGACTGTGTCTVSMTQARSVTATFATVPTWTLTTSTSGTGTGSISSSPSGISCGATCTATFNDATSVTLTATAGSGSTFTGWTGACTGTGTCTVSMTQARSVTATFTIVPVDPVSPATTPTTTPVEPTVDPAPANTITFGVASISPSVGTRNSKTTAALITVVTAPGSGTVRQTVSWRVPGRKRAISACRAASTTVAAPGSIQLTCALNAKTQRALQRRSLKVTLRTTFTPVGGTPTKLTRTTTIKRAPRTAAEAVQTSVETKGPGTITQTGTLAASRARAATRVCTSVLRITKAGTYDVGCSLTPYGAELLQRQDLRVTLTTTYTPKGGGKPVTISRVVYLPRTVAPGVTG